MWSSFFVFLFILNSERVSIQYSSFFYLNCIIWNNAYIIFNVFNDTYNNEYKQEQVTLQKLKIKIIIDGGFLFTFNYINSNWSLMKL